MSDLQAFYFDGKSTDGRPVTLELDAQQLLHVRGSGIDIAWPLAEVRTSERIGASRRRLYLPDGAQCETGDNDAVDRMFAARESASARLVHRWESRLGYALVALAITVFAAWGAVVWGIPALAKQVAFALPSSTEKLLGSDALAALDRFVFKPSQLPESRQNALREIFAGMTRNIEGADGYRLEFRKGGRAGANALALPAGTIVMTDEMAQLSKDDQELEAVLAHEIGHMRQRHILRHVLQDSGTALLIAVALGDVFSLTSLAAAAPTLLLQAKFSRDFEREADDFALDYLARRGIPPQKFAAILQRMEEKQQGDKDIPDFLSTHPATRERINRATGKR